MVTARLSDELNNLLVSAKSMERSKSYIVSKAVERYLIEAQEDIEDIKGALEALGDDGPTIPWKKVKKKYTLED